VLLIALYAVLFDFVTPLTPTPVVLVNGKMVPQPALVALPLSSLALQVEVTRVIAESARAVPVGHPSDPLDLSCSRRC
jgi:hypothetical protein